MGISVHNFVTGGLTGTRRREFMDRSMDTTAHCGRIYDCGVTLHCCGIRL